MQNFNSHAHVERDGKEKKNKCKKWDFNSHAHVERDVCFRRFVTILRYFNSHAHVERDQKDMVAISEDLYISTHTLTWSVTLLGLFKFFLILISTHTLTWSVTIGIADHASVSVNFNSHAHVERDRLKRTFLKQARISTHTLTWSVTI